MIVTANEIVEMTSELLALNGWFASLKYRALLIAWDKLYAELNIQNKRSESMLVLKEMFKIFQFFKSFNLSGLKEQEYNLIQQLKNNIDAWIPIQFYPQLQKLGLLELPEGLNETFTEVITSLTESEISLLLASLTVLFNEGEEKNSNAISPGTIAKLITSTKIPLIEFISLLAQLVANELTKPQIISLLASPENNLTIHALIYFKNLGFAGDAVDKITMSRGKGFYAKDNLAKLPPLFLKFKSLNMSLDVAKDMLAGDAVLDIVESCLVKLKKNGLYEPRYLNVFFNRSYYIDDIAELLIIVKNEFGIAKDVITQDTDFDGRKITDKTIIGYIEALRNPWLAYQAIVALKKANLSIVEHQSLIFALRGDIINIVDAYIHLKTNNIKCDMNDLFNGELRSNIFTMTQAGHPITQESYDDIRQFPTSAMKYIKQQSIFADKSFDEKMQRAEIISSVIINPRRE